MLNAKCQMLNANPATRWVPLTVVPESPVNPSTSLESPVTPYEALESPLAAQSTVEKKACGLEDWPSSLDVQSARGLGGDTPAGAFATRLGDRGSQGAQQPSSRRSLPSSRRFSTVEWTAEKKASGLEGFSHFCWVQPHRPYTINHKP